MSSSPPIGLPGTGPAMANPSVPALPARRRLALVLDPPAGQRPAWWLDPVRALLFIVLPIFCFAAYLNQFNYSLYNASENFVTWETFALAMYSAGMLILGIAIGRLALRRQDLVAVIDPDRCTRTLVWFGWIAIVAYALLLGTLVYRIDLVLELFRGNAAASSELRLALGRIPGVTSFVQFGVVFLALLSTLVTLAGYRMPPRIRRMALAIIVLTFLRSILNSERLALLEILAAMFIVPVAYRWQPSALRNMAPFVGIIAVFFAFAAGEYFRSWQYYQIFYDSYLDFVTQRFAGYFSTSINNGAGAYTVYGQVSPTPEITIGWISRFPVIGNLLFDNDQMSMLDRYLIKYATLEFNNPGGFYAAFLDYGFGVASLFMVMVGSVIGFLYKSFQNRNMIGLMLFPSAFLGLTDFIRIIYIVDTRTLPIFLGAAIAFYAVRPTQLPRDQFMARLAAVAR